MPRNEGKGASKSTGTAMQFGCPGLATSILGKLSCAVCAEACRFLRQCTIVPYVKALMLVRCLHTAQRPAPTPKPSTKRQGMSSVVKIYLKLPRPLNIAANERDICTSAFCTFLVCTLQCLQPSTRCGTQAAVAIP